jgi:PAS domain S-box-containing protein
MRQPEEWLARIHPDDRDRVRREFEAAVIANADEFGTTHRIVLPDGEQRWVAPQGVILRDEAGQPLGAVGVCADVTAAQQAEQALRRERELLQTIIDSIPVMITIYDPDTNVLRLNPEFERVTGWTAADADGGSLMEQCYPDPEYREQVRRFMDACGSGWKDLQMCARDGRQVETTWANIRLTNGLRVGIGLDATERRRTELALRDADRRKDEFLAMLAHELRNPLAPILAAVQILHIVGADEAAVKQQRELIERQVQQMRRLLDDLLDVSRITRGKIQLGQELVDLSAVLAQAIEASRPMVEAKGHELSALLGQEPLWIKADRLRLAQVFTNLLNNAAKYTDPGGRITIGVERSGEWVAATVRDSGIGMTPDVLSNAFDLFAQADNSLHRAQGGLGIGLTVAKRLVEMHGGVIAADSQGLGLGSEFTVRLPLAAPPADASDDAKGEAEPPTGPARRVLVVDDNVDAAQTLAMLLRLQRHDVRVAFDGLEGLEVAREYGPDVVLLDIGLPKMDGYETARALRASTTTQRAVLIAISGYGQAEDRRRSLEAGFDQHFVKPLDSTILQQAFAAIGPANLAPP